MAMLIRRTATTSKPMLLPLPDEYVRAASLRAHLALAVCRAGKGNRHQLYQLIRMTYLSYLLWKDGYGEATQDVYSRGEGALEAAAEHAYACGNWELAGAAAIATVKIIQIYDSQLSRIASGRYLTNLAKLEQLLRLEIPRKLNAKGLSAVGTTKTQ